MSQQISVHTVSPKKEYRPFTKTEVESIEQYFSIYIQKRKTPSMPICRAYTLQSGTHRLVSNNIDKSLCDPYSSDNHFNL